MQAVAESCGRVALPMNLIQLAQGWEVFRPMTQLWPGEPTILGAKTSKIIHNIPHHATTAPSKDAGRFLDLNVVDGSLRP